jgi:hypothetical protein
MSHGCWDSKPAAKPDYVVQIRAKSLHHMPFDGPKRPDDRMAGLGQCSKKEHENPTRPLFYR